MTHRLDTVRCVLAVNDRVQIEVTGFHVVRNQKLAFNPAASLTE